MKRFIIASVAAMLIAGTAYAKTLMLEGKLNSTIAMRQQMEFSVDQGTVQAFTFKFALPADFQGKSVSQSVDSLSARFDPQPSSDNVEQDRFGNSFRQVVWNNARKDIRINLTYSAAIRSELSAMESRTPFPIGKVTGGDSIYLNSTEMVQSDSPEIAELARRLTTGAKNEYEAVTAITNHVADSIKYTFNPPQYDALYTLQTKSGNCQNFAHLSIALLRNIGIPARIVGGITLKDSWKVPIDAKNSIVQSMGQGGHAWMEIYFPDLGWLPYDPQQSRQFTSTRHIKQTHGLDSRDINDTWRGAPYLPRYSELIEGTFKADDIKLKVKNTIKDPRPYIISNLMAGKVVSVVEQAAVDDSAALLDTQN
ncbi:MAG: transglutaminase-like domain-containing protein, partial [Deltaproteobacteria bacterium]